MGCGTSNNAVGSEDNPANGHAKTNGHGNGTNGHGYHDDDLPTEVLPETPIKPKPPIAFEIPLEEFEGATRDSPPPHLQRLLQPTQPDISLPDIEEKLAEAELRRQTVSAKTATAKQTILQQRAASAQKRMQKVMKCMHMERLDDNQDGPENIKNMKHGTLTIPPEPGICEDKNI